MLVDMVTDHSGEYRGRRRGKVAFIGGSDVGRYEVASDVAVGYVGNDSNARVGGTDAGGRAGGKGMLVVMLVTTILTDMVVYNNTQMVGLTSMLALMSAVMLTTLTLSMVALTSTSTVVVMLAMMLTTLTTPRRQN